MARQSKESLLTMLSPSSASGKQIWLCLLVICGFTVTCTLVWNFLENEIVENDTFLLDKDKIVVSIQPDWISSDIRANLIQEEKIKLPVDIRDQELTENISKAFKEHAWVKDVTKVAKQYPAKVSVSIEYRKPVAMVEVVDAGIKGVLPVDQYGVLLPPDDFSKSQVAQYPRINVGGIPTTADLGEHWGDARVAQAASIANVLLNVWAELNLHRIVAIQQDNATYFEIHTKDQQKIIWGSAPGSEHPHESVATQKLGYLQHQFLGGQMATLEQGQILDLRNPARLSQASTKASQ